MEKDWERIVTPKIKTNLQAQLKSRHLTSLGHTTLRARAYLEKNGSLKKLRIEPDEVQSDLPKAQLAAVEQSVLRAIKQSAPLPYSSVKDSRLPHLGLIVTYETQPEKLEAGITMPEDHPDVESNKHPNGKHQ
jgi:hypothetical protein